MTTYTTRTIEGDPQRVAVQLPGGSYGPDTGLLWYARIPFIERGWTIRVVHWGDSTKYEDVPAIAAEVVADAAAGQTVILAKSLGTLALPWAVNHGVAGVWLTPVLTQPDVAEAVARAGHDQLLIGGTADRLWDSEAAHRGRAQVIEIDRADHGLHISDDLEATLAALRTTVLAVDAFIA